MTTRSSDRVTLLPNELAHDTDREFVAAEPHSRVVRLDAVPWLNMTYDELAGMRLDQRHGFLVSLVDGRCTIEMLADMTGFGVDETAALVAELVVLGVLTLRDR